jgi:hypothetical protein
MIRLKLLEAELIHRMGVIVVEKVLDSDIGMSGA